MTSPYSTVRVGDLAPDFTLPTDAGTPLTLSSLRGKRVVLFFYPKDSTPGCTVEACEFGEELPRLKRAKAVVLGVAPGTVKSKATFKSAKQLPFTLLADEQTAVAQAYGVWKEKVLYGRKYFGVMRTTYVIGKDGRVEHLWESVAPAGHAAEVSAVLRGVAAPVQRRPKAKSPRAVGKK
jgi:peroxiredoxin Q/BCP